MSLKPTKLALAIAIVSVTAAGQSGAQDAAGYDCVDCPANWENLEIEGNNCGGSSQSPVAFDAASTKGPRSPRVELDYGFQSGLEPDFTETNIEWGNSESTYSVWLNGEAYFFKQFHFHTTSEHVVNGERSSLEMHFVNKTSSGAAAVVGVFIEPGAENIAFSQITNDFSDAADDGAELDLRSLLPEKLTAFSYTGSTTTPPCSAGVEWRLLTTPVKLSQAQIDAIRADIWAINDGFDNNRPIQNREGRNISLTGKANKPGR